MNIRVFVPVEAYGARAAAAIKAQPRDIAVDRQPQFSIRARAPLRLGLAGGGTDLSPYCDEHGGAVLNCTIDRYAYCFIEPTADDAIHFVAHDLGVEEKLPRQAPALAAARLGLHAGVYRRMTTQFAGGELPALKIASY